MKILFVCQDLSSFVKKDLNILKESFCVREIIFRGLRDIFGLLRGVIWADVTFSWFGKLHAFFAVLFSKILRKRSIVVAGGDDVACVPEIKYGMFCFWWKRWCPSFVFRYADFVIPVSRFSEKETLDNAKADPKKIKMIYHGFSSDLYEENTTFVKERIVITIGTVSSETIVKKGLRLFVESAKLLPDTKFLLIGPDKDGALGHLKETAPKNVEFLGGIYGENLVKICSRAKVYVQASVHESFGCSLAEAMLCECIPVVFNGSALPEVVGDCGYYANSFNPEEIAVKIKMALNDDVMGKRARERISQLFPLDKRRKKLLEVINSLN